MLNCNCDPDLRAHFIHNIKCQGAADFVKIFHSKPAILEDFEDCHRICCCSPELDHTSSMRVRLYKNKAELPKLFSECEAGLLKYMDNMPFREPIWREFQAIGFEKVLKTVYLGIKQERRRIIFVFGPDGSGKTPVAKQIGNMFIERKCFNDIKYINMDKISNMKILVSRIAKVSGFLQNRDYLKNIPPNLEGFVVLENINCLVENHSTEFMELLKELLERTKLHFLIVCTFDQLLVSNHTLNLSRTSMKEIYMPSLSVQKAARLLQMVCIDKLEEQGLTLKEIQNHSIFHVQKDEKLIPRKVFDIGFLLNKGFTLDQCEELIAENRAKSLELAGEATLARVALMTTLRHRYVEYYDILCFLTFFRQGLLLQDLNEGAAMLSKSDFWVKAVFIFTKVTTDSEFDEYHCDYEQEVTDHRDHGKTEYEICNLIYEDRGRCFGKEQVLKMHKEDVLLRDDIIIRATYSLKQAINLSDRDSEYTSWKSLTRVCNFYQSMLHAMIQKLKIGTGENIIESSALSLNPFWHNVSFKIQLRKHYISDSKYQRKDVRELLGFHENNLRKLLTATDQFSIYGGMRYVVRHPQYLCTFLELIEELLVEILTVYSMLESKDAIAEMTHSIRELLQDLLTLAEPLSEDADTNESAEKLNDLSRLDIKIELHRLSTTCNSLRASTRPGGLRSLSNEETTEIEQQLRSTLELLEKYSRPDGPAFKMEFLISKYFLYAYNKFKSTTNSPKIMEQVINQLEILEKDIPAESDTDYELIRAKTAYTLAHFYKTNRKPFTSRLSELLTSAIKTFSDFGLDFLRLKTIKLYLDTADISLPEKITVVEEAITLAHKLKNEKKKKHFERILKDLQAEKESLEMSKILFLNNFQVLRPDEEPVESRRHSKQQAERSRLRSKKPKKAKDGSGIPSKRVRRKSSNAHNRYFPAHQRPRKHDEGEQGDGSTSQNEDHSIGMTDEEVQSKMEVESNLGRELDKGLVFLTRELRSVVFNDLQKLNKKLLIEFDHFSNRKFKELLSRRTGAVCRICVVDAPIYVNPNPVSPHKASTPSSKNHSQTVLQMIDPITNSSNPPGIPPTDVLIILGELRDKGLVNAIAAARIPYVISLQLSHKILHRLDLLNSVLVHSFKYCFLQRLLKELIEGKHIESAVQAAQDAAAADVQTKIEAQEIKFWDLSKIENTVHGILPAVHEIDYTSYFANCVRVASSHMRSDGKSTSGVKKVRTTISFKSGSITEMKSIYSTHKFFEFRRIPLRREDLLKRLLHEVKTQTSIINLYGKDGCGKTGFVKMMLNEVKSWNFYPDGVHLFSLKHFAKKNPGGKIRDLMKQELGTEFDLNPQQYFENRKMLLVFDDFHIVTKENELEFPSSLVNILLDHATVKVFLLSVGKIDLRDMGAVKHFEIERMTDQETLMLIFTLRKGMYFKYDAEKFEQLRCSDSVREAMKRPRKAEGSDFINREIKMNIPHHAELHLNKLQKVQHHGAFSTVGQHKHCTDRGKHHHHQHHNHSNLAHDMNKPMSERKNQLDSSVDMSLTKKISTFASSAPQEQGSSVRSGALQLSEIGSVKSPSQNSKGSHFHKVMNFEHQQPESATLNDAIKHHRDKDGIFREVRDIPESLLARTHSMANAADKVGLSLKYLPKPEHPSAHGGKTARSIAAHSHQTLYDDSSYEEETHSMSRQAHIPDGDCKINSSLSHYKQDPRSKFKKAHSVKSVDVHYTSDSSLEQPEPTGMKSSRGMPTKYEKKVNKAAKQQNIAQTQAKLPPFKPEGGIPKIKSEFLLELDEKTISKRDPDTGRRGGVITTGPLPVPSLTDLAAPQPTPSPKKKRRDRPRKNKKKGQPTQTAQTQTGADTDQHNEQQGKDSNGDSDAPDDDNDRAYRFPHK